MSAAEVTKKNIISAQAVDEEYEKLERFQVDRRQIVFFDNKDPPQGGFGIVLRAELHGSARLPAWLASRWYGRPQLVAVKQIKAPTVCNIPRVKRAFTGEMLVWSSFGEHPGISKFLGFYADFKRSEAWLLSPWEPNGNVSEFIKAHNLEVPEQLSLIYDTVDALTFLHQLDPPVCHGDIKAANVLVGADYKARLCDFGLARLHEDTGFGRLETSTGMKGSIRWCSPEILDGALRAPTSDVYAWAWLVWEIMTRRIPYEETNVDFVIMRQIFESLLPQIDGPFRLGGCLQVWELMTRCWNPNPLERPTAKMCKTTIMSLPRCTPTPANADHRTPSPALLETLGDLESWKGNQEESSAYFDEAMQLYREEGETKGIASVLLKQAGAARRIADFGKLRAISATALEHCRVLNDDLGVAKASYYLGNSLFMLGEPDEALPNLHESLEIRRRHVDDVGVVECLERIGVIQMGRLQVHEAISTLGEAVAIASRSGDRVGLANALGAVGYIRFEQHDFVGAAEALSEAITITRNIGWEGELSVNLGDLGRLKVRLEQYREAERLFQESISIARRIGSRYSVARGLMELGDCFIQQSNPSKGASALEESFRLYQELSQAGYSQKVASELVELKCSQGDWNSALFWQDQIIPICRTEEGYLEFAGQLERKGEILMKVQRYDEAALHFEAAMLELKKDGFFGSRRNLLRKFSIRHQLCAVPKVSMEWDRPLSILQDKKMQRRLPQLITAVLIPSTPTSSTQSPFSSAP